MVLNGAINIIWRMPSIQILYQWTGSTIENACVGVSSQHLTGMMCVVCCYQHA